MTFDNYATLKFKFKPEKNIIINQIILIKLLYIYIYIYIQTRSEQSYSVDFLGL